jgi:tetratricopeptide (TPR) repeat protein
MLGSIQIKRGELKEAMQIYELALSDAPVVFSGAVDEDEIEPPMENLLAKSVTFREMGTIHEMWGNVDEALKYFHKSLECVAEWRETVRSGGSNNNVNFSCDTPVAARRASLQSVGTNGEESSSGAASGSTRASQSHVSFSNIHATSFVRDGTDVSSTGLEHGEMELVFESPRSRSKNNGTTNSANEYERFFPYTKTSKDGKQSPDENCHADMDLSLTLHQIAQLYRAQGKFSKALDAYEVALRGMKTALGEHHPNVAAVLGNIGNLQKDMGNLDAAYMTYQEVLGIESYRLGLSHPDVAITLHNIATIDAARGNYEHALQLYRKVMGLQKKLFGEDNVSVAVTAACMGDVYEKIGEIENSMDSFDEAVRIKSAVLGRHSLDVGRLLHKLGKLSLSRKEYLDAESYTARAIFIYRLNKIDEDHQWFVDAQRDAADIDAAIIVTGDIETCEI